MEKLTCQIFEKKDGTCSHPIVQLDAVCTVSFNTTDNNCDGQPMLLIEGSGGSYKSNFALPIVVMPGTYRLSIINYTFPSEEVFVVTINKV